MGQTTRAGDRAFTLVELMITVAIVGVLAALATIGVSRYMANAKTAEARAQLGRMGKDAVASYAREIMEGKGLALGGASQTVNRLCVGASKSVPSNAAKVAGKKYQSDPGEWTADAAAPGKGFSCLRFSVNDPQYFMYEYNTSTNDILQAGKEGTTFEAVARGDLDGDGTLSRFTLRGKLVKTQTVALEALIAPNIEEQDSLE
jgi:type IV pilus assembly protein PilA